MQILKYWDLHTRIATQIDKSAAQYQASSKKSRAKRVGKYKPWELLEKMLKELEKETISIFPEWFVPGVTHDPNQELLEIRENIIGGMVQDDEGNDNIGRLEEAEDEQENTRLALTEAENEARDDIMDLENLDPVVEEEEEEVVED